MYTSRVLKRLVNTRKFVKEIVDDSIVIFENALLPNRHFTDLVILDDTFPFLLSTFRVFEFNYYLETFDNVEVHSIFKTFSSDKPIKPSRVLNDYYRLYPKNAHKIIKFNRRRIVKGQLGYLVFLANTVQFIDFIEQNKIPFVFTLYPGGGFQIDQVKSDEKLRRICSSSYFRGVIVTQKITRDYLINNSFCDKEMVEFIYGGVFPSEYLASNGSVKKYYKQDKCSFDVCFVAHKYMPRGIDKGYDVFIEVAKKLSKSYKDIFFHVVGPFDKHDIDVSGIDEKIRFYGPRTTSFFLEFYSNMDIILSPNAPFILNAGGFDGFPTGSCIEAGICGVAVFCTDQLQQNIYFRDNSNIVIITRDPYDICERITYYYKNYDSLYDLSEESKNLFRSIFSEQYQLIPRRNIISRYLGH
jgi:glycosyltransferase involved in cell wall biosynthesis